MSEISEMVRVGDAMPRLIADGKVLSTAPNRMGLLTATDPNLPLPELTARFRKDGYLWLKGFFDRRAVLDFRRFTFAHLAESGLIARGTDPEDGVMADDFHDRNLADKLLMEFARSAAFESFCMTPRLWQFMDSFLGGLSYLHKRKIIRYTMPKQPASTPAHYDLTYLRGGTEKIVTAWIPIGDTVPAMGGLTYLEGSHEIGVRMEREFTEASADLSPEERVSAYNKNMTAGGWVSKDLPDMANKFDARWLIADYEAGDVMLHSPYMIHAATTNEDPRGRLRLSTDIRYQNVRDEIDARWNNHWSLGDML